MILKASQRSGASQLAAHLLNDRDNDHVRVFEVRGFASSDLHGAFQEAQAVSRGTKCRQYLFSLSLNPPKNAVASEADFTRAADEAEKRLGLSGQPRAIVIHEKEGRCHAHVVWSRIDADEMKAINLPFFKRKLTDLSRDLHLDHGWTLPDGLRTNGGRSPLNFTLAEWQQARRAGVDPREVKDAFRDAWARSDSLPALKGALEERGYFLAQGDRRGFVAVDTDGEVYALARQAGVKTKEVSERLGKPDALPTVADVRRDLATRIGQQVRGYIKDVRVKQARDLAHDRAAIAKLVEAHRRERVALDAEQSERFIRETRDRAARFRTGLPGLWDSLTGRKRAIRHQNEAEAIKSLDRDRRQRDDLAALQMGLRQPYQLALERTRARHAEERKLMIREALGHWRRLSRRDFQPTTDTDRPDQTATRARRRGPSLDL